jgi:hypothetical protein
MSSRLRIRLLLAVAATDALHEAKANGCDRVEVAPV